MRVIGIDPAPKKAATLYDRDSGWTTVAATELPATINKWSDGESTLVCWDAPLSIGGNGEGCYYERPIESFFRNHREFTTPDGISVRPFAGCPHWAITHATLGLPVTGNHSVGKNSLPLAYIASGTITDANGHFVTEVHPAVALWLWCRNDLPSGPWTYKKLKRNRGILWATFSKIMADHLPKSPPKNDDEIDAFVAYLLGELWIQGTDVTLLGDEQLGSFLVPRSDKLVQAFSEFTKSK